MDPHTYAWNGGCLKSSAMAYLNVKERRLEAKVAYIGAHASGRTTNFEHLGQPRITDAQLALFWQPKSDLAFRDCSVRVEMVASRGESSAESVRDLLRAADGVVFVADADPAALGRNRMVLGLLREALAEISHAVPVVVQVNKTDLAGAADTCAELAIAEWPQVEASAITGVGVAETAERVVESVLESLRRRDIGGDTAVASAPSKTEGNPLLAALRQVLRETVASYVAETEKETVPLLERIIAEQNHQRQELALHRQELAKLRSSLAVVMDAGTARARQVTELGRHIDALARSSSEQQTAIADLHRSLALMPDARADMQEVRGDVERTGRHVIERLTERLVELDGRTAAIGETYQALIEELKKPKKSWFG